jgi:4-amino-4-deoxy-L-arabinose transferase-like glycosyltransferase
MSTVAVLEQRVETARDEMPASARRTAAWGGWWSIALTLVAGAIISIRLEVPAFFDNEGRYAAVSREMFLSGDFVTPRMGGTLFLNKPPLTYWLAALTYQVTGLSEWARLVSVVAGMVMLFATCRLGALLWGERAGLLAGLALVTMVGFPLESRILRPDMTMAASVATALLCWAHVMRGRERWLWGFWAALGVGMLAKGFVPLVLAGMPVAAVTFRDHGWQGVRRVRPLLGLAIVAAIVLPWHIAVSLEHRGFAWDYVVNQHLLFFLDKKLPRDSNGDPLLPFLGAFLFRTTPWVLLLPITVREAFRGFRRPSTPEARGTAFVWAWVTGLLAFFSLAPSRLEHYTVPVMPAVALLAARACQRAAAGTLPDVAWRWIQTVAWMAALAGAGLLTVGRTLLGRVYWMTDFPALLALVAPAGVLLLGAGAAVALTARARSARLLPVAMGLGALPLAAIVLVAERTVEPLFSWRPVAEAIRARAPDVEVAFEAPNEYQLVGGLVFYGGRNVTLLEPPGFTPPTYLEDHMAAMFEKPDAFERRWRSGTPLAIVSDPTRRRDTPDGIVPPPYHVLARFGDRWILTNFPPAR